MSCRSIHLHSVHAAFHDFIFSSPRSLLISVWCVCVYFSSTSVWMVMRLDVMNVKRIHTDRIVFHFRKQKAVDGRHGERNELKPCEKCVENNVLVCCKCAPQNLCSALPNASSNLCFCRSRALYFFRCMPSSYRNEATKCTCTCFT